MRKESFTLCFKTIYLSVLASFIIIMFSSCSNSSQIQPSNELYEDLKQVNNPIIVSVFSQYKPKYDVVIDEENSAYFYYKNNVQIKSKQINSEFQDKFKELKSLLLDYNFDNNQYMADYKTIEIELDDKSFTFNYHKSGNDEIDEIIDYLFNYAEE